MYKLGDGRSRSDLIIVGMGLHAQKSFALLKLGQRNNLL
jgi:hypothetical protein